jgi:Acetyltransferase (GNAT) domain
MPHGHEGTVQVAGRTLRLPGGVSAHLLSDESSAGAVDAFVSASPDHTVYHRPPYIEFAQRQNGAADLLMLSADGRPIVAFPFHPTTRRVSTGYAGVCFPSAGGGVMRRGMATLESLSELNSGFRFQALQSAQAPAVDDASRTGLVSLLIDSMNVRQEPLHTRLIRLSQAGPTGNDPAAVADVDPGDGPDMADYDGDLRNQVRQAARRGVTAHVVIPTNVAEAAAAYAVYQPIHAASWHRTGMKPHDMDYLLGLETAVRSGGGRDVVVFAHAPGGAAVAAVTCHVYGDRAIYLSGCSLPEALPLRANPYCLHAAIQVMRRLGVRTFETGRFSAVETNPKEVSVTRYKAQFGGDVQRVLNFELGAPRLDAHAMGRAARNRARRWLKRP